MTTAWITDWTPARHKAELDALRELIDAAEELGRLQGMKDFDLDKRYAQIDRRSAALGVVLVRLLRRTPESNEVFYALGHDEFLPTPHTEG